MQTISQARIDAAFGTTKKVEHFANAALSCPRDGDDFVRFSGQAKAEWEVAQRNWVLLIASLLSAVEDRCVTCGESAHYDAALHMWIHADVDIDASADHEVVLALVEECNAEVTSHPGQGWKCDACSLPFCVGCNKHAANCDCEDGE